jgi:hypothetical protein
LAIAPVILAQGRVLWSRGEGIRPLDTGGEEATQVACTADKVGGGGRIVWTTSLRVVSVARSTRLGYDAHMVIRVMEVMAMTHIQEPPDLLVQEATVI